MKPILTLFTAVLFLSNFARASFDSSMIKRFRKIVRLIETDNAKELSKLVQYPLKRTNPLPDIHNAGEFITYYPILFDNAFKQMLKAYDDSVIFEHHNAYGLVGGSFSGEIWIDEDGKVSTVNYSSAEEQKRRHGLTEKIKKETYGSVNTWDENVVVARSEKLLIRVDRTDKGLRYVCWGKGKTQKDPPDIVLYNGTEEAQGTQGGWTWTFKNGNWTYIVDDAELCEEASLCGFFLELQFKEQVKSRTKLKEIK
jgi:hypothetical protein